MNDEAPARICIFGAGSIGCYVGGRLAGAGAMVTLIGRERIGDEIRRNGLHLSDWRGARLDAPASRVRFATTALAAEGADLVLVTVKSSATAEAGRALADLLSPEALVISFQNGLGNADALARELKGRKALPGMVGFNVVNRGMGCFHHGSEGELMVQADSAIQPFESLFAEAGLPLEQHQDFLAVQWAKLLLNLNNSINALSGLPLKTELSRRPFRRVLAMAQKEALLLLHDSGITPARLTPIPPQFLPLLLCVPDLLFRLMASRMLAIDPLARSSMWEDLQAGRRTEVDWLNGEVVQLADKLGRTAPVNARLVTLIRAAETGGKRDWTGRELLKEIKNARREA